MKIISYLSFMKKYYIYHIKGKKIGCTENPKARTERQGFDNYEILEEHTDIIVASDRERELQKQWGYSVDTKPYWKTIQMPTFKSRSKGGKMCGHMHINKGHMDRMHENRKIPIIQMDKLGNPIKEFPSANIASDILDLWATHITRCCKGTRKTTGGYKFKYK